VALLQVLVAEGCLTCRWAVRLAREVQQARPSHHVVVLDVSDGEVTDHRIVGTPTYLIDGEVAFMGNPERDTLLTALDRAGS
jgi:hypothetical protein